MSASPSAWTTPAERLRVNLVLDLAGDLRPRLAVLLAIMQQAAALPEGVPPDEAAAVLEQLDQAEADLRALLADWDVLGMGPEALAELEAGAPGFEDSADGLKRILAGEGLEALRGNVRQRAGWSRDG